MFTRVRFYRSSPCSASIVEDSFGYLDAPVERIAGADVPMPYAANLERMALPQVEDIVRAAKRVCYRSVPMSASASA
ncbi:UNVERIFIED_CONTAM: Pyruvate dehydrogenase E1 component subunit beta-1, mitochondrial [Sesamum radiatum]|uniref:Pyruvate dehydrogenase E1 component subunit beta n=1 Tax=Sesamum radiatum TaxID=300843 RepID=A0AAW2MGT8_SESRA